MRVGYELAMINSLTSASGIIVLLKTPTKYRGFFPIVLVKATDFVNKRLLKEKRQKAKQNKKKNDFQLVFYFEQTRRVIIFGEHGVMAHLMAKPIRALELYYPMVQFLIIKVLLISLYTFFF